MKHNNKEIWLLIRQHPDFSSFTQRGDTWRDWGQVNPATDINLQKGTWFDHKTNTGGSLYSLAERLGVLPEQTKPKGGPLPTPQEVWRIAKRDDTAAADYLSGYRGIPQKNFADVLHFFRIGEWYGKRALVHPFLSVDMLKEALAGRDFEPPRIQMILLDSEGRKIEKKHRGQTRDLPVCFILPPLSDKRDSGQALVLEGVENALSVRSLYPDSWLHVATCKAGLKRTVPFLESMKSVSILADHDLDRETNPDRKDLPPPEQSGQAASWRLAEMLKKTGISAKALMPPMQGLDANDALRQGELKQWIESLEEVPEKFHFFEDGSRQAQTTTAGQTQKKLVVLTAEELLSREVPPRVNLLDPWLPAQGLAMIHGWRGGGKTWLSLSVAYTVACGGRFLKWEAPQPGGVLFCDGELPLSVLKERLAQIVAGSVSEPKAPLLFLTPDCQEAGLPDLSTLGGQQRVDKILDGNIKLLILDNLSCLARTGLENDASSWNATQEWLLRLRASGKSVLMIHHSGKSGQQRGTSKREDILDSVLRLQQPSTDNYAEGARFEIHFEKSRGFYGDETKPFEASLAADEHGIPSWTWQDLEETTYDKVSRMHEEGMEAKDIAADLNISRQAVYKHLNKLKESKNVDEKKDLVFN